MTSSRSIPWAAAMLLSATSVTITPCASPSRRRSAISFVISWTCNPSLLASSGRCCCGGVISLEAGVFAFGSSPVVTGISIVLPLRQTVSLTVWPIFFFRISRCNCVSVVTGVPSTFVITSKGRRSLLFAGASATIVRTTTPLSTPCSNSRTATKSLSVRISMPSHGRAIFFPATNC